MSHITAPNGTPDEHGDLTPEGDSLIAPIRDRAVAYSKATARATVQGVPPLLTAVRFRPFAELVDIACGPGYAAGAAAALGAEAVGVDIAADMVAVARTRHLGVEFRVGDALDLPYPSGRFDMAVCNFGMPHFEDPLAAVREAHRVLKPGGRYAFTQWRSPFHSPFFSAFDEVARAEGAAAGVQPTPGASFRLSEPETCEATLKAAGFSDIALQEIAIEYDAPHQDFLGLLDDLALPFVAHRVESAALETFRAALNDRMATFLDGDRFRIPMPAMLASGAKARNAST